MTRIPDDRLIFCSRLPITCLLTLTADRVVVERSMLIKNLLDDLGGGDISQNNPIPVSNVRCIL